RLPRFHPQVPEEEHQGMGSGTIVRPDGYILSNYHVIAGADSIAVTLADRRTFSAEVVGFDSLIDIALLKIDAQKLPTVPLADSDRLQIGDWVLAIGHPLGMGSTLTHGIVSALGRQAGIFDPSSEENRYAIESFIQTNAVINPGNSGGPLLDLHGRVIGINTAISTHTRYYIGYSLAVPINLAQEVVDDLLTHGRIVRGYLGVSMETELTQELIAERGLALERPRGVYLSGVKPQSPAARGGLRDGDVILSIDGSDVNHSNQIQTLIYGRDPGDAIELQIVRDNQPLQLAVILGEREDDRRLAQGHRRISRLGLSVERLPVALAMELGFDREVATELGFDRGEGPVVVMAV
ncbi:MAG: trypsin-like peptidase domain-containing protein, partial [Candidatus Latescibacteria bacterium]|nr:trypsin-like peptidase domain-containing protein [Candidatus Latescibacterota bacterium]